MGIDDIIKSFDILKKEETYIKVLIKNINELELVEAEKVYCGLVKYVKNNDLNIAYPWVINNLAWVYYDLNKVDKCITLNEEALYIFEAQNNIEGILSAINALVSNYSLKKEYEKAVQLGIRGIKLAEENNEYHRVHTIKNNIAFIYMEMDDYEKAKELLEQLLLLPRIMERYNIIVLYINIAECDINLGNPERALDLLKQAEKIAKDNEVNIIPVVLDFIGRAYTGLGEYQLADKYFKDSIICAEDINNTSYCDETLIWWGALDYKVGKYSDAIEKLIKAEDIKNYRESERNNKMLYELLHKSYKAIGDFEKAYDYFEKFHNVELEKRDNRESSYIKMLSEKLEVDDDKVYKVLYNQTKALYSLGQKLTSNLSKDHIYKVITEEMRQIVKADVIQLGIIENNVLEYKLVIEGDANIKMEPTPLESEALSTYAINNKQQILISDLSKEHVNYLKSIENFERYLEFSVNGQENIIDDFTQSMIFVPIIMKDKAIGIISTQCYEKNAYTLEDMVSLQILSTYLAIALENTKLYEEIEYNSKYDNLTKIFNRGSVLNSIQEKYNSILNVKDEWYILMIDIDNFKKINDTYGHQAGDKVLAEVSKTIAQSIGKKGIVGRYGGEEIIALINESKESYLEVAERIRENIEKSNVITNDGTSVSITVSIGVANMNAEKYSLKDIISFADKALYRAKHEGKNRVVYLGDAENF